MHCNHKHFVKSLVFLPCTARANYPFSFFFHSTLAYSCEKYYNNEINLIITRSQIFYGYFLKTMITSFALFLLF